MSASRIRWLAITKLTPHSITFCIFQCFHMPDTDTWQTQKGHYQPAALKYYLKHVIQNNVIQILVISDCLCH